MTRKKTPDKPKHGLREAWLQKALNLLRPIIQRANHTVPDNIRIGVGWPYGCKNTRAGECWDIKCSADQTYEIFITPKLADPAIILHTLVHELVHTITDMKHGKLFKQCAAAVGLEGKIIGTYAGEELAEKLHAISIKLGPYPHGALLPVQKDKQTTRLLKIQCRKCGCTARVTRKWLDEYPKWPCPCGGVLREDVK